MLKYITDIEYKELLGVNSIPENFIGVSIEASAYINKQTQGRIDSNNVPEKVKYATCLIVNLLNDEARELSNIGNLKSENIEGWAKTFATPDEIKQKYSGKMKTILGEYLWDVIGVDGNPLLYCGGIK